MRFGETKPTPDTYLILFGLIFDLTRAEDVEGWLEAERGLSGEPFPSAAISWLGLRAGVLRMRVSISPASAPMRTAALVTTTGMAVLVGLLMLSPATMELQLLLGSDKTAHLAAFAGLILPVAFITPRDLPRAAVLLVLFGALIELLQPLVGRTRDIADFVMNLLGLGGGAAIAVTARRWREIWTRA